MKEEDSYIIYNENDKKIVVSLNKFNSKLRYYYITNIFIDNKKIKLFSYHYLSNINNNYYEYFFFIVNNSKFMFYLPIKEIKESKYFYTKTKKERFVLKLKNIIKKNVN